MHRRDGVGCALDHAGRLPVVILAREARVWTCTSRGSRWRRAPWAQNVGLVAYYLLIPFAIYGFVLLRRRRIPVWILMSPFLVVVLTAALFYGWLRFREPAEISLVVLAGVAIDGLWTRIREARSGALESRMRDSTATPPTAASPPAVSPRGSAREASRRWPFGQAHDHERSHEHDQHRPAATQDEEAHERGAARG